MVLDIEQNSQDCVALGSARAPPASAIHADIYSPQVWPDGGLKVRYSSEEHCTLWLAIPVEIKAEIRYVSGETRYIKCQNPGSSAGVAITLCGVVSKLFPSHIA